tara:strand:+ start:321 stop:503 length:183 start_codon:yes stop_codon:yes gene_type:complete
MNWIRPHPKPDPPIRYHDKMRQWTKGTWPYSNKVVHDPRVDDGTDDAEVIDAQHAADIRI